MSNNSIAAIIVSFNPDGNIIDLISSLDGQVDSIILVDNGSENFKLAENLSDSKLIVERLGSNEGIACAQNVGIEIARTNGYKYVVFFDQDSVVPTKMIYKLFCEYEKISNSGIKIAAVGPIFCDLRFNFVYPQILLNNKGVRTRIIPDENSEAFEVSFIISSGSLISLQNLAEIGDMKAEYFIDYVDTEWCMRATSKGFKIFVIPTCKMEHAIGDDNIKFLNYKLPVHSAWRRYYRMRNMYYLFKLPYIPLRMKIREFITNTIHQFLLIWKSPGKRMSYIRFWVKSQFDGVKILMNNSKTSKR